MYTEYRVEGTAELELKIQALGRELKEQVRDIVQEAAQVAFWTWRTTIPYHTGELSDSIVVEDLVYEPGRAGGGGFYTAKVSVAEHDPRQQQKLRWVTEGTGIFGPTKSFITPRYKKAMKFESRGETIFTKKTIGQAGRDRWIELGQEAAAQYMRQGIATLESRV